MHMSSGDVYNGQWMEGLKSGTGEYIFANSDRYEGEFRNGLKTKGIESTSEGVYKGSYVNGYR